MDKIAIPDALSDDTSPEDCIKLIIECVRYKRYVAWAESCVRYLGPQFAHVLIDELRTTTKSPVHRGRLVDLLAVTGVVLAPWDVIMLTNDRACKCKPVRDAVARLLTKRGLDGKPTDPVRAAGLVDALRLKRPR